MSKEANELLLNLLASRIDAAGAHCSDAPPPEGEDEPDEDEDDEDEPDDKGGTKIRFL